MLSHWTLIFHSICLFSSQAALLVETFEISSIILHSLYFYFTYHNARLFCSGLWEHREISFLLLPGVDKRILLWNIADGVPVIDLTGHTDSVYALCFSRDGHALVSGNTLILVLLLYFLRHLLPDQNILIIAWLS